MHSPAPVLVGPGLVGSYLGCLGGFAAVVPGPSGKLRARQARDSTGTLHRWQPQLIATAPAQALCLVCTRVPHTPKALPAHSLLAQNGLSQAGRVLVPFLAIDADATGVVLHRAGTAPRLVLDQASAAGWQSVITTWRKHGIVVELVADIAPARWAKAILNATVGPLCLAHGLGMAAVWADTRLRALVRQATREGVQIAAASGVRVNDDLLAQAEAFFASAGAHTPSALADGGAELPAIIGALLAHAAQHRVAAPALGQIAQAVASRSQASGPTALVG